MSARRPSIRLVALVLAAAVIAACGGVPAASPADPASPVIPATASPTATPIAPATAAPSGAVVDAGLLDHLPGTIDGVDLVSDAITAEAIAADPTLGREASAIAIGRYGSADASRPDDLAIVSVVQLRPGVHSDDHFASWRADYDASACAAAGGATGSVERTIGANQVFVGTCAEGAMTYHVHLPGDVLVSITAVGPRSFGEQVAAALR